MEFVIDALPVELIDMNSAMMCNYINIRFCSDRLLPSALAVTDTSKLGTRLNGWKLSASKAKPTSLRNVTANTSNQALARWL